MSGNPGKAFESDNAVGYRHQVLGADENGECPYLERWVIGVGPGRFWRAARKEGPASWFSVRLHHFFRSDEDHLHDHPFWFLTLVLRGSYDDLIECPECHGLCLVDDPELVADPEVPKGADWMPCERCTDPVVGPTGQVIGTRMTPGVIRYRSAHHRHRVVTDGCWTLLLSGPKIRDWGFFAPEGWLRQRDYFRRYGGNAACE